MAYIRLDSLAFERNLNALREHICAKTSAQSGAQTNNNQAGDKTSDSQTTNNQVGAPEMALVLKDNAYGHGLEQIAALARAWGIKSVFVKNYAEAQKIAHLFPAITALYGRIPLNAPSNIYHSITSISELKYLINELESAQNLDSSHRSTSATHPAPANSAHPIELKVNIGMNRNGISFCELDSALELIAKAPRIRLAGVFAHNGYGDNDDKAFEASLENFAKIKRRVCAWSEAQNIARPRFHSLSTSGALRVAQEPKIAQGVLFGEGADDLVRIGIGAYGYHTSDIALHISLTPIASLWAQKISSHFLEKGERIGYGGVSVVRQSGVFSTYDVGYGDGLFRLSGKEAPLFCASGEEILPIMSMDCFSCAGEREEVCVFDDVREYAKCFGTIPYVILTHLSPFLKRVVV
ncbi:MULTISPECIES: alanine racemase [unclassified Helicobacter]|uniref:alanine racemase n=1 Tax=unclassified Helicobacter TaxID=2593540 RepID=UPI0009ED21EA|nr:MULTISPECIES: alanine racemase [unclassified Helicobacter]